MTISSEIGRTPPKKYVFTRQWRRRRKRRLMHSTKARGHALRVPQLRHLGRMRRHWCKFSKVSCLLNVLHTMTIQLTFENFFCFHKSERIFSKVSCLLNVQPIALGVSFNLNLQSRSPWSLFHATW